MAAKVDTPTTMTTPAVVVLSYAVCGSGSNLVVLNGLQFTRHDTRLIVHTCQGTPAVRQDAHVFRWLEARNQSRRFIANPLQLRMAKSTPSVLAAHLSNFELCDRAGSPCAADVTGRAGRFVLMAGNSVVFRPGLEAWVSSHSLSFCSFSAECTDVDLLHGATAMRARLRALEWRESPRGGPVSPLVARVRQDAALGNDSVVVADPYFRSFVELLKQSGSNKSGAGSGERQSGRESAGGQSAWRQHPVASLAHEGSFYPFHVLRTFKRSTRKHNAYGHAQAQAHTHTYTWRRGVPALSVSLHAVSLHHCITPSQVWHRRQCVWRRTHAVRAVRRSLLLLVRCQSATLAATCGRFMRSGGAPATDLCTPGMPLPPCDLEPHPSVSVVSWQGALQGVCHARWHAA